MLPKSDRNQKIKPPPDEFLDDFSDVFKVNQQILKLENETARLRCVSLSKEIKALQNILTVLTNISSQLDRQSQQMGTFNERLDVIESQTKRTASDIAGLSPSVVTIEKNLEQLRNLTERIAGKSEELSGEFVERYIKEPTIEHIGSLYNSIRQKSQDDNNGDHSALLEETRQLLEAQGARVIEPEAGSEFDPKEHRPVKKMPTLRRNLDRKVARVFRSGFAQNGRVIQHAVVEIFMYRQNIRQIKRKGEQNEFADKEY